jgi:hypothetical protein
MADKFREDWINGSNYSGNQVTYEDLARDYWNLV